MNIGNISQNTNTYFGTNRVSNTSSNGDFQTAMTKASHSPNTIMLHGSVDCDGNKVIGALGDAVSGVSTTVYKPADFDDENPAYLMRIWDDNNNLIEERTVDISELNLNNCDSFDMYAYACHLSDSGERPDAITKFVMMDAQSRLHSDDYNISDMYEKHDWISVLADLIKMQKDLGNYHGYLEYKNFYDYLIGKL